MTEAPKLAPPGAGIPLVERLVGRFIYLKHAQRETTWAKAIDRFAKEKQRILDLVEPLSVGARARKVLIERLPGLEDSSRYWSVAETIEHLQITGSGIASIVRELAAGRVPPVQVDTAKVKPNAALAPAEAASAFRTFAEETERALRATPDARASTAKLPHPWFGPLNAHGWLCLLGIHQRLHRRQIEAILAGLPR